MRGDPFKPHRQWQKRGRLLEHVRSIEAQARERRSLISGHLEAPLGTEWAWDRDRGRPQLRWLWPSPEEAKLYGGSWPGL